MTSSDVHAVIPLIEEYMTLFWERKWYEDTWQDIEDNLLPNLSGFSTNIPIRGQRWDEAIIEGTPRYALATFQAGLMGRLMSASFDWLAIQTPDEDMMDDRDVREWLSKVNQAIFSLISRSNFYPQTYDAFGHAGAMGTATMYRYFDTAQQREIFSLRNPREIFLADNSAGECDTVVRLTWMTYKQMIDAFSDDTLDKAVYMAAANPSEKHRLNRVLHVVKPNPDFDPRKKDKLNKRFKSYYVDLDHENIIREGGYSTMPYAVWRIEKEVNEPYGRGPGWRALADIKALYAYAKTGITGAQLHVNPPLEIPEEQRGRVKWVPGGRNYYEDAARIIHQADVRSDLAAGLQREQAKQQIIERHFLVPFFTMMQQVGSMDRQRTAYEVRQIEQETAILLGPYATGFQVEFMDHIVEGLYNDAMENHMFPPPPPQLVANLQGRKLEVVYSGPLATAQKAFFNLEPYHKTLQDIQTMLSVDPTGRTAPVQIMDIPDWDRFFKEMARGNGLPEEAMNADKQVLAARKAKAQQQQQQQQLDAIQKMGGLQGMNQPVQGGSPLDQLSKMAGAGQPAPAGAPAA
jgi:Bacteriophage head to tail connecting protein